MDPYKEMYLTLFNAVTDAITLLQSAQCKCEALYQSAVPNAKLFSSNEEETKK